MRNRKILFNAIKLILLLYLFSSSGIAFTQTARLNIRITDSSMLPLGNATIEIDDHRFLTDSSGLFQQRISKGYHHVVSSAIGYQPYSMLIYLSSDTSMEIRLVRKDIQLETISIIAGRSLRNKIGHHSLSSEQLKKMPVILGETDPLKTITLLPGIKNGGEGGTSIYVRGGGPDQNLILLDNIPVYNPNHLFGFFSIFNGDIIRQVDVKKGDMPAAHGGRLSSVVSVDTREGNKDSVKYSGGIGLISSKLTVEGPVSKNKASFMLSGRRTYIDQFAKVFAPKRLGRNGYYFYDINAKINYTINTRNELKFLFYNGHDAFRYFDSRSNHFTSDWGNRLAGLSWEQTVRQQKLKQTLSLIYTAFQEDSYYNFGLSDYAFISSVRDYQLKNDWYFTPSQNLRIQWGFQHILHRFAPGAGEIEKDSRAFKINVNNQYARESAGYLSTKYNLTNRLSATAGMRYSFFNTKDNAVPPSLSEPERLNNKIRPAKGEQSTVLYHYPEPRINMEYRFNDLSNIILSYTRVTQYLHLATTVGISFPSDLWVPAGKQIYPGKAEQISIGYFKKTSNLQYNFQLEAYYKILQNQVEYKPGAQLLFNPNIEEEFIFGEGKAYGLELLVEKKRGKLTGWAGYTLSRTERTFPELNSGKTFPYRYDRTHDLSITANYQLSSKWNLSTVFVFATGNTFTVPTGQVHYNLGYNAAFRTASYTSLNQYNAMNNYRMPPYHRLDLAATYSPIPKREKRFRNQWNFTIYNVYNRQNPYFIYIDINQKEQSLQGKMVYLFPFMPSIGWNFNF